jgi:hypothetical protein
VVLTSGALVVTRCTAVVGRSSGPCPGALDSVEVRVQGLTTACRHGMSPPWAGLACGRNVLIWRPDPGRDRPTNGPADAAGVPMFEHVT